jgi:hypothetical protein
MANQWQYGIRKRRGVNNEESNGALAAAHIAYQNGGEISVGENENAMKKWRISRKWRLNNQPAYGGENGGVAAIRRRSGNAAKAKYRIIIMAISVKRQLAKYINNENKLKSNQNLWRLWRRESGESK